MEKKTWIWNSMRQVMSIAFPCLWYFSVWAQHTRNKKWGTQRAQKKSLVLVQEAERWAPNILKECRIHVEGFVFSFPSCLLPQLSINSMSLVRQWQDNPTGEKFWERKIFFFIPRISDSKRIGCIPSFFKSFSLTSCLLTIATVVKIYSKLG